VVVRIHEDRDINLVQVIDASGFLGSTFGATHHWQNQSRNNRDDGNYYQQFNQCKSTSHTGARGALL
jgi:hypothetical protein